MSRAGVSIGCPTGGGGGGAAPPPRGAAPTPEVSEGEQFSGDERLKGTTVDCHNCGDEFELYFY
ncbi:hypothetical protein [Halorussus amylolyticus]|uniref:hypothetical protein n=1 Tax=Halorussus amylolyticus TaxID=1126242 RepID=UPI00138F6A9E|nr:hypothetical protein [Halorussus amylolyticus]